MTNDTDKKSKLLEVLDESIVLEYNAMKLYILYSELFPVDRQFWSCISKEEMFHAELLEGLRSLIKANVLPEDMLYNEITDLKEANANIANAIETFSKDAPTRREAFDYALILETTGSEMIFQKIIMQSTQNNLINTFKDLAGFCKDHARRISTWMRTNNIKNGD